jgi:hypothetical protein
VASASVRRPVGVARGPAIVGVGLVGLGRIDVWLVRLRFVGLVDGVVGFGLRLVRRFTRLTNAFSKQVRNHAAAVSLHFYIHELGPTS